jgi:hypothetical protein
LIRCSKKIAQWLGKEWRKNGERMGKNGKKWENNGKE